VIFLFAWIEVGVLLREEPSGVWFAARALSMAGGNPSKVSFFRFFKVLRITISYIGIKADPVGCYKPLRTLL